MALANEIHSVSALRSRRDQMLLLILTQRCIRGEIEHSPIVLQLRRGVLLQEPGFGDRILDERSLDVELVVLHREICLDARDELVVDPLSYLALFDILLR